MDSYEKLLHWLLKGWRPVYMFIAVFFFVYIFIVCADCQKAGFSVLPQRQPNLSMFT